MAKKQKRPWLKTSLKLLLTLLVIFAAVMVYLDIWLLDKFKEKAYSQPASVYARPLELYPSKVLSMNDVVRELTALHYRNNASKKPGSYSVVGRGSIIIQTRPFQFGGGEPEGKQQVSIQFANGRISKLWVNGRAETLTRLEPLEIGRIHPNQNKDRLLVQLAEVPESLAIALMMTEDRNFYDHFGISLKSIARALVANIRKGGVAQGGSTITQQLVKNFFLSSEQSLGRKAVEALLAILLELHAEKDEILEAYINEVFVAQDGARAIHGFGLASEYLFSKSISDLALHESALLVAMLKGPSYYNPIRNPERAKKRRNLVLDLLSSHYSKEQISIAKQQPVLPARIVQKGKASYPAYLDLVRRQIRRDYNDKDLATQGLRIFSNFDPLWQWRTQDAVVDGINRLEKRFGHKLSGLEGAAVVVNNNSAEVIAIVGSKQPRVAGFNRALDARRQVGSLVKPAVYLAAFNQGYGLHSMVADTAIDIEVNNKPWQPQNFDKQEHGQVLLLDAFAKSYNLSAANIALEVGIEKVANTLQDLGIEQKIPAVPALSLGAVDLSPLSMAQMYTTIANQGFYSQLNSIRKVTDSQGRELKRYPLKVEQRFSPQNMYLLNFALQQVMHAGTGRRVLSKFSKNTVIAGKTGTSDQQRDSWFAGFDKDKTAVVWLGLDDNNPMPITGSSGALPVWADILQHSKARAGNVRKPDALTYQWIDRETGLLSAEHCKNAAYLPLMKSMQPKHDSQCTIRERKILHWFKKWFQ